MAINPETQYPGKIAPSTPDYPYGAARNVTLPGDGTGTPWESALVNDLFGFQQALLSEASVVPSGLPDKVGGSQYLDALRKIASTTFDTLSAAVASTTIIEGATILISDREAGKGGGALWDVVLAASVTTNGFNIVQCTGIGTLALKLRIGKTIISSQWGVIHDGVTDSSAAVQHFLEYWRDNQVDAEFDKGEVLIDDPITVLFTSNNTDLKSIKGNATTIISNLSVASPLLKIQSQAVVRHLDIQGITFRGQTGVSSESSLLELDGGNGGATQFLYNMTLDRLRFENSNGHGLHVINNVFETNLYSCFARAANNTTGFGFYFEDATFGAVSSIEMFGCVSAGWLNGLRVDAPASDIKIHGGTFILAYEYGVNLANYQGSEVSNVHFENNWESAVDLASGGAGLRVLNRAIITGCLGTTNSKQKYVVDIFCSNSESAIIGGIAGGATVKYAKISGNADTSITMMNEHDFDMVNNNVTVIRVAGGKVKVGENTRESTIEISKDGADNSRVKIARWTGVGTDYNHFEMVTTGTQLDFKTGAVAPIGGETVDQTMFSLGFGSTPKLAFYGATPINKPDVSGSKGGNAALTDLINELAALGIITDSTT